MAATFLKEKTNADVFEHVLTFLDLRGFAGIAGTDATFAHWFMKKNNPIYCSQLVWWGIVHNHLEDHRGQVRSIIQFRMCRICRVVPGFENDSYWEAVCAGCRSSAPNFKSVPTWRARDEYFLTKQMLDHPICSKNRRKCGSQWRYLECDLLKMATFAFGSEAKFRSVRSDHLERRVSSKYIRKARTTATRKWLSSLPIE